MSGYLTVANEAIAIARSEPIYTAAILRLYMDADLRNWGPFDCSDRWLVRTFDFSMRQARDFLRALVQAGCLVVVDEGDRNTPRSVRLLRPENAQKRVERGAKHPRERVREHEDNGGKPTHNVSGAPTGARDGARDGAKEDTSSTSTSDTSTSRSLGAAVAAALDDPKLDVEVTLKAHVDEHAAAPKATPLVTAAWDAEFHEAFGTSYPWAFEGRDHDGSKLKRWLKQAKVDPAHPQPGVDRLQNAFRAYFSAVRAGSAFPPGKATTQGFDYGRANWLQTDPGTIRAERHENETLDEMTARWFGGAG